MFCLDDLFLEFVTQMREKTQRKKVKLAEPDSLVQEEAACGTDTTDNSTSEQTKGTPSTVVPSAASNPPLPSSTDIHQGQFNPMKDAEGAEDQDNFF